MTSISEFKLSQASGAMPPGRSKATAKKDHGRKHFKRLKDYTSFSPLTTSFDGEAYTLAYAIFQEYHHLPIINLRALFKCIGPPLRHRTDTRAQYVDCVHQVLAANRPQAQKSLVPPATPEEPLSQDEPLTSPHAASPTAGQARTDGQEDLKEINQSTNNMTDVNLDADREDAAPHSKGAPVTLGTAFELLPFLPLDQAPDNCIPTPYLLMRFRRLFWMLPRKNRCPPLEPCFRRSAAWLPSFVSPSLTPLC